MKCRHPQTSTTLAHPYGETLVQRGKSDVLPLWLDGWLAGWLAGQATLECGLFCLSERGVGQGENAIDDCSKEERTSRKCSLSPPAPPLPHSHSLSLSLPLSLFLCFCICFSSPTGAFHIKHRHPSTLNCNVTPSLTHHPLCAPFKPLQKPHKLLYFVSLVSTSFTCCVS